MLDDVTMGRIDGLIFSKLARLARNTRECLEIAEHFKNHNADLISIGEDFDTSTPAGKLFFTLLAALAEWERSEISARVKAAVPIRAKMGKSLGGAAPFGYKKDGQKLVIDSAEAPVRKMMYDLFLEHRRRRTVAKMLNEQGYRTRKGSNFSDTTITRLLKDPIAMGLRRMNYTESLGKGKNWQQKPKEEWVIREVPAIISKEIFDAVNEIIDQQQSKRNRPQGNIAHLFTSHVICHCKQKMYADRRTEKYRCRGCNNKIGLTDLEDIFREQLHEYVSSQQSLSEAQGDLDEKLRRKMEEFDVLGREIRDVKEKMDSLILLHRAGEIPLQGFGSHYNPLHVQHEQMKQQLPLLEKEIVKLKSHRQNIHTGFSQNRSLYEIWPMLEFEKKRAFVEHALDCIVIHEDQVEIRLSYIPEYAQ